MGCVSCTKEKKNYNTHTKQKFNNNTCRKCLIPCESLFVCAMWWRFVVSAKPNRSIFSLAVFFIHSSMDEFNPSLSLAFRSRFLEKKTSFPFHLWWIWKSYSFCYASDRYFSRFQNTTKKKKTKKKCFWTRTQYGLKLDISFFLLHATTLFRMKMRWSRMSKSET